MGGYGKDGRLFVLSSRPRCILLTAILLIVVLVEIRLVDITYYISDSVHKARYGVWSTSGNLSKVPTQRPPSRGVKISQDLQDELDRRLKAATGKKVILVWFTMFGDKRKFNINATKCGNCEITYDRSKINDENVGAVVFHFDAINAKNMPRERNPNQLYIFWAIESTSNVRNVRGHSLVFEDSFLFNATMTYRRDSDFYQSYEFVDTVEDIVESNTLTLEKLLEMKTKMGMAMVSNCGYTKGAGVRFKMLKELERLNFGVECYGNCFGKYFAGNLKSIYTDKIRKYKFYFAFENSHHCKDYITEKFFIYALMSLAVPVVWGGTKEDYEAVAPPGSFIFVEDFSSMKELSEYLIYLDGNDTAYLKYLEWITMNPKDMPQYGRAREWCHLCRALHGINIDDMYSPIFDENHLVRPLFTDGIANRTVNQLSQWYFGEEHPECFG